ncbi:hypothetical protein [Blastomonas sp. AAP53]|uniref:hypothetical protein n=1 Tax=Blastomonas sp. AAP53 TaxID=1248760 RepID=UPI00126752E3|nr:hypothetical protein [Blastomonas sp. AAP53]
MIMVTGCSLLPNDELNCASNDEKELITSLLADSKIPQSFQDPFMQSLASKQGKLTDIEKDPEYQRLNEMQLVLQEDLRSKVADCFDDEKHPQGFRFSGTWRQEICDRPPIEQREFEARLMEINEDLDYFGQESKAEKAALKYFSNYASNNIRPILNKMNDIIEKKKDYTSLFDQKRKNSYEKNMQEWLSRKNDIVFDLKNIILVDRNEATGAVECKADLNVSLGELSSESQINFTVEKTSEGELYGTVFGI